MHNIQQDDHTSNFGQDSDIRLWPGAATWQTREVTEALITRKMAEKLVQMTAWCAMFSQT